jgi:hypothetical protein
MEELREAIYNIQHYTFNAFEIGMLKPLITLAERVLEGKYIAKAELPTVSDLQSLEVDSELGEDEDHWFLTEKSAKQIHALIHSGRGEK